jgi:hypothetical protein
MVLVIYAMEPIVVMGPQVMALMAVPTLFIAVVIVLGGLSLVRLANDGVRRRLRQRRAKRDAAGAGPTGRGT